MPAINSTLEKVLTALIWMQMHLEEKNILKRSEMKRDSLNNSKWHHRLVEQVQEIT